MFAILEQVVLFAAAAVVGVAVTAAAAAAVELVVAAELAASELVSAVANWLEQLVVEYEEVDLQKRKTVVLTAADPAVMVVLIDQDAQEQIPAAVAAANSVGLET